MVNARTSPGRRRARGFTLIEIMVSSGLLLFLLGSTMNVLIATNNSTERVRRIGATQEVARLALDALAADIASAGLGVGNGRIGTVPGTLTTAWWVPAIYSGPDITVLEPGGRSTIITNSIYIVGAEPTSMGMGYAGTGKQGVVLSSTSGTPLSITCSNAGGTGVGCDTTDLDGSGKVIADPLIPGTLPPLLVGDFTSGIYITPTSLQAGVPPTMTLDYLERTASSFAPNAKNPGFAPGANISRARVVHWYLRQDDPNAPPRLYRSKPILDPIMTSKPSATGAIGTVLASSPFIDETVRTKGPGVPVGVEMGAGPIQNLQIRYVIANTSGVSPLTPAYVVPDPTCAGNSSASGLQDDPTRWEMINYITAFQCQLPPMLREVRIQLVSIASVADKATNLKDLQIGYVTPSYEGAAPVAVASKPTSDPYPRRAFSTRVSPRSLQGGRQ